MESADLQLHECVLYKLGQLAAIGRQGQLIAVAKLTHRNVTRAIKHLHKLSQV